MSRRFWQTAMAVAALVLGARCVQAQTTIQYYHADAIGSVRLITDQAGAVVAYHDYVPFGTESPLAAVSDPRLFAGQERDVETGFDYVGARYFSSAIGRFTRPDDAVFSDPADPQSWNQYTYALNNPLRYVDPSGHAPEDCPPGTAEGVFCTSVTATPPLDAWALSQSFFAESFARFNAQVSGFGEGVKDTVTTLFSSSGPQSCLTLFARETVGNLVPINPSLSDLAKPAAAFAAALQWNRAQQYAASRLNYLGGQGLLYAMKSSLYRGMVARSTALVAKAGPVAAEALAMGQALTEEKAAWQSGQCR